jgi:Cd2+/Zn2+-exporting ATPase
MADTKIELYIDTLDCVQCAQSLERDLNRLEGVDDCTISYSTGKLQIDGEIESSLIINRLQELGHKVRNYENDLMPLPPNFSRFMLSRIETRLAILGVLFVIPGLVIEEIFGINHLFIDLSSFMAIFTAGLPIFKRAWIAVRKKREITIDLLMSIAAIGAVIIGAFTEAGMTMVLFAFGEALEGYTSNRARFTIRSLMQIAPNRARRKLKIDGQSIEEHVDIGTLSIGDVILVHPGERIPMDGQIIRGESSVNQAPITGESRMIDKKFGSDVFAGSINGEGVLEIQLTHLADDNMINQVIHLVEEAQSRRAPMQRIVDRFAQYYTPIIVGLAIFIAAVPPLFFNQPFFNPDIETTGWLYRGLTLLVVACPCALVISTPVSIISGISNAARKGVLFKGGAYIEMLSRVKAIAFDKTGTLTIGKPSVISVRSENCDNSLSIDPVSGGSLQDRQERINIYCESCNSLVALAGAVGIRSGHPMSKAIAAESVKINAVEKYSPAETVNVMVGEGVTGKVGGREVLIGSHEYFDLNVPHNEHDCFNAQLDADAGHTPIMVSSDGEYLGTITLADTIRSSSKDAIDKLKGGGINSLVMLSGDNVETAKLVGDFLGLTDVRAGLMPEEKLSAIESLRDEYEYVAMVGDGVNDAPALALADVGIAMGGAYGGTDQAMETADITLMSDDLRRLPFAFDLSRKVMKTIRTNIFISISVKLLFLLLVLLGVGTMWMAVLSDTGVSLLVTLNGMRLAKWGAWSGDKSTIL